MTFDNQYITQYTYNYIIQFCTIHGTFAKLWIPMMVGGFKPSAEILHR